MSGSAIVSGLSRNKDVSEALATAVGADMQRYLDKFAKGQQATEDTANKLSSGDYFKEDGEDGDKKDDKLEELSKKPATYTYVGSDSSPKTGDTAPIAMVIALMGLSGAGICTLCVSRKKKNSK